MTGPQEGLSVRYARWIVRWRWLVLALSLLSAVGLAAGAKNLAFDNDYRIFFSEDNPELNAFESFQNIYTKTDSILIAVKPSGPAAEKYGVFNNETLQILKQLTEDSWKIPYAIRVDSPTNYQHTEAVEDDLTVADLVARPGKLTDAQLNKMRDVAVKEPSLVDRLVSGDANTAAVFVTLQMPGEDPNEVVYSVAHAEKLADEIRANHPNVTVAITGIAPVSAAFPKASIQDMETLIPLMYLVLIVSMGLFLRSITGTIGTVLVIGLSAATAMGIGGWMGIKLTPPSASAPTIIMTIAIADCVHILVTMFQQMRKGLSKNDALVESLRLNMEPVFLTSLTTVIGFLSLNFSDSPPFGDLGNLSAFGVTAAWVYAITFLPAFVAILPVKVKAAPDKVPFMDKFADVVINRRKSLMWGMSAIVLVTISFIPRIELDDQFIEYFDYSHSIRPDTEFISKNLRALPAMFIPISVFAGIYTGYTTVTESAGVAAIASVLIAVFIYREVKLSEIFGMATEGMKAASAVTFIVMFALLFAHWITGSGIPTKLVDLAIQMDLQKWQFLLILNVVMIILGMFLDAVAVMLIVTPIILPVLHTLGIDPVHFGIVLIVNMEIAFLTPPIGLNLFVLSSIARAPMSEAVKGMIPFVILMAGFLILITYVPEISLWLPRTVMN